MKKYFLLITLIINTLFVFCQSLSIESKNHERFRLYVNDVLQNNQSVESICISNITSRNYVIRIESENSNSELTSSLRINPSGNNYILHYFSDDNRLSLQSVNYIIRAAYTMPLNLSNGGNYNDGAYHNGDYNQNGHNHNGHDQNGHNHEGHQHGNVPVIPQPPIPVPEPVIVPQPCDNANFNRILDLIDNETFDDTKLTIAKQVVVGEWLTTDQLVRIAKLFTYEDTKLDFLKFAYDYCFDQNRYYLVNSAFTFSSSKEELNEYIRGRQ